MKDDLETDLQALEEATAGGDRLAERLDPESAALREAWLAFGEMLEAAQPANLPSPRFPGEQSETGAVRQRRRWQRLLAAAMLAASLLVAVATIWMLGSANRQDDHAAVPEQTVATNNQRAPPPKAHDKSAATTDALQWDDSIDEQIEQLNWQMLCVQENQAFRTDAFGQAQYRLERVREAIQADAL